MKPLGREKISGAAAEQLSFDLGAVPQRPPRLPGLLHRDALFFAVLPTPAAALRIAQQAERLRRQHGLRAPQAMERLHISLAGVGIYSGLPDDAVSAAVVAGSRIRAAPFDVTFDRISSFKGADRRPLVLLCGDGLAELTTFRHVLTSALRSIGLPNRPAFTPHVTLLYDRRPLPDTNIDEPITWTVRDFVLVHSLQGQGRHVHRACWPLRG